MRSAEFVIGRFLACAVLLLTVVTAPGCGGRDVEQVPVSGKVTLDGGPMPGPGTIYFNPVSTTGGGPLRPSSADFGTDGKYTAGAFGEGKGLIPGEYRVRIVCWKVAPNMEDDPVGESYIPARYGDAGASGLGFTVDAGSGAMTKDFALSSSEDQ